MDEKQKLEFKDWQEYIKGKLGKENWLTVYECTKHPYEKIGFYCALIPPVMKEKVLADVSWDLLIGQGMPGHIFYGPTKKTKYFRYGNDKGIEPLIVYRSFYGVKKPYLEVSEEFRHLFNLYQDEYTGNFVYIDDNGDEKEVVRMGDNKIQVRLSSVKKFLAIKNLLLAIYFEIDRFEALPLKNLDLKEKRETYRGTDYIYRVSIAKWDHFSEDKRNSFARLSGKKLIKGLENYKPDLFYKEEKKFVNFIIGVDENGNEITHTCDEDKLSDYFGKNPAAPHYLTPVFFKKEVLNKYFANSSKYSVEDGYLRCGGLWGLRMDNNHEKYVIVFLGDLGRLSYREQVYWKSFNIPPDGTISVTMFRRGFLAEFADPERSDLYFKQKFRSFQEKWKKQFDWHLFLPLSQGDKYHFTTLRIPLTNEQKEFDEQVLSLTKILIDSLNEKELAKGLTIKEKAKGIDKLEAFLASKNIRFLGMIEFLRNLQCLRSTGVAHLKGKNYDKIRKEFGIGEKELSEVFDEILIKAIRVLNSLESKFLKSSKV